ncbi:MAG: pyridoxamine 5'-phosphate oxidase family protein [Anaerolineae bacterium]|nr:pyridoxamine 5'-phosphate oxidase family protein [Thermoflexales bacterium]MDW8407772.1 pyridoxamine 5'-phosphate oxidase family protein [Anaerolineae bacterium]
MNRPNPSLDYPRRKDRTVTDEDWIKSLLRRAAYGVLASICDGQPYAHVNLFAYDEPAHALYWHTAAEGRLRDSIAANPRVCFCVSEMGRLLPAKTALNMSVEYASVVVFGRAVIVNDLDQAQRGLQLLLDKYFTHLKPDNDYRSVTAEELSLTTVYRLDIESWSGKRKQAEGGFPGAFFYRPPVPD